MDFSSLATATGTAMARRRRAKFAFLEYLLYYVFVCVQTRRAVPWSRRRGEEYWSRWRRRGVVISSEEARFRSAGVLFPRCGGGGSGSGLRGGRSCALSSVTEARGGAGVSRGAWIRCCISKDTDTSSTPGFENCRRPALFSADNLEAPEENRQKGGGARDHRLHDRHPGHGVAVHKEDDCEAELRDILEELPCHVQRQRQSVDPFPPFVVWVIAFRSFPREQLRSLDVNESGEYDDHEEDTLQRARVAGREGRQKLALLLHLSLYRLFLGEHVLSGRYSMFGL